MRALNVRTLILSQVRRSNKFQPIINHTLFSIVSSIVYIFLFIFLCKRVYIPSNKVIATCFGIMVYTNMVILNVIWNLELTFSDKILTLSRNYSFFSHSVIFTGRYGIYSLIEVLSPFVFKIGQYSECESTTSEKIIPGTKINQTYGIEFFHPKFSFRENRF